MIIDCISDLHGHYPQLEGGDLLIVAGDLTNDTLGQVRRLKDWIVENGEKYKKIILIAGNHDNWIQKGLFFNRDEQSWKNDKCWYLEDSGTEFEYEDPVRNLFDPNDKTFVYRKKIKIWGSPWTLRFPGMNPHCMAFTVDTEEELAEKWEMIPYDTDVLITHEPPMGYGDEVHNGFSKRNVGSLSLFHLVRRSPIKLHVYGHVHEGYGQYMIAGTKCMNASHVNERYEPVNKPIRIEL